MAQTLVTGLSIGTLCVAWTFVMRLHGLVQGPGAGRPAVPRPVILFEVVLLVLGLKRLPRPRATDGSCSPAR